MVDKSYMLGQLAPPSALTRYFHQATIPATIDGLAAIELALNRLGNAARQTPIAALSLAFSGGIALALALRAGRKVI
jgi:hypothetical protein